MIRFLATQDRARQGLAIILEILGEAVLEGRAAALVSGAGKDLWLDATGARSVPVKSKMSLLRPFPACPLFLFITRVAEDAALNANRRL
jgi:hypothetical protein